MNEAPLRADPQFENPSVPQKRRTSYALRAMADRELAEGNSKIQLAQVLREAADVVEQMEQQS